MRVLLFLGLFWWGLARGPWLGGGFGGEAWAVAASVVVGAEAVLVASAAEALGVVAPAAIGKPALYGQGKTTAFFCTRTEIPSRNGHFEFAGASSQGKREEKRDDMSKGLLVVLLGFLAYWSWP